MKIRNTFAMLLILLLGIILGTFLGTALGRRLADTSITPAGVVVTQSISPTTSPQIDVNEPVANQIVQSPVTIRGRARGNWFFEGTFPVKLYDNRGNLIAQSVVEADGDWMTESFVPFVSSLEFRDADLGSITQGVLVFTRSNTRGDSTNNQEYRIPVRFNADSTESEKLTPQTTDRLTPAITISPTITP